MLSAKSAAGTGVGASCGVPRAGQRDSVGDVGMSFAYATPVGVSEPSDSSDCSLGDLSSHRDLVDNSCWATKSSCG